MEHSLTILAYIGPETILPVTSALAATVGVLLMFGHRLLAIVKMPLRLIRGKPAMAPQHEAADAAGSTHSADGVA